jgi:hypothetical protein
VGFSLRPYKKQAAATVFHRVMWPDASSLFFFFERGSVQARVFHLTRKAKVSR